MRDFRFWFFLVSLVFSPLAHARWAEPSEFSSSVLQENLRYRIEASGAYSIRREREVEIYKDAGRSDYGLTRFTFDSQASSFVLEEAYTLNGKEKTRVKAEHIEVKPLASSGPGFDEKKQMTIAFPKVEIGSRLYYRTEHEVEKPRVAGIFSTSFSLGWNEWQKGFDIAFDSENPLYFEVYDPQNQLERTEAHEHGRHQLSFHLKTPIFRRILQEENGVMDPLSLIWIGVTTLKDWAAMPDATPEVYEKTITSPLPDAFQPILAAGAAKKADLDQINAVTSTLAARMRYVGDWVSVEGAYHPRPLAVVAETAFGDCKDFSSSTAAILRHLGFAADVAWVDRGRNHVLPPIHPAVLAFDHAIVHAVKNGNEYWIDPTNFTSFAQHIYEDIADRPALIVHPGKMELKATPPMRPEDAATRIAVELKIKGPKEASSSGTLDLEGRSALGITGWGLSYSKSQIDYYLIDWLAHAATLKDWKFGPYDLSSRIAGPFHADFSTQEDLITMPTSAGRGVMLPSNPFLGFFQVRKEDRVSALSLGFPTRWGRVIRANGMPFLLNRPSQCKGKTHWVDFSSSLKKDGQGIAVEEMVTTKTNRVSPQEFHSVEFQAAQDAFVRCMQPATIILR